MENVVKTSSSSKMKDFDVINKLGQGSFGIVYKVRRKGDKNIYVLKQINMANMDTKMKKESINEAKILSTMECPYIVKYYDSFAEKTVLNIVMEYCEGGDLYGLIKSQMGKWLSEARIWRYFIQMTLALNYLHRRKVLHRDMKTLNVFLTKDQNDIRIGDLGVAKMLASTGNFAHTMVGTPYYLSPEMCEERPYNEKSDVWALGCVLYELCTFKHPFEATNQAALILKIIKGKYPPVSASHYSSELIELVDALLNKDYRKRPTTKDILTKPSVVAKANQLNIPLNSSYADEIPLFDAMAAKKKAPVNGADDGLNVRASNGANPFKDMSPKPRPDPPKQQQPKVPTTPSVEKGPSVDKGKLPRKPPIPRQEPQGKNAADIPAKPPIGRPPLAAAAKKDKVEEAAGFARKPSNPKLLVVEEKKVEEIKTPAGRSNSQKRAGPVNEWQKDPTKEAPIAKIPSTSKAAAQQEEGKKGFVEPLAKARRSDQCWREAAPQPNPRKEQTQVPAPKPQPKPVLFGNKDYEAPPIKKREDVIATPKLTNLKPSPPPVQPPAPTPPKQVSGSSPIKQSPVQPVSPALAPSNNQKLVIESKPQSVAVQKPKVTEGYLKQQVVDDDFLESEFGDDAKPTEKPKKEGMEPDVLDHEIIPEDEEEHLHEDEEENLAYDEEENQPYGSDSEDVNDRDEILVGKQDSDNEFLASTEETKETEPKVPTPPPDDEIGSPQEGGGQDWTTQRLATLQKKLEELERQIKVKTDIILKVVPEYHWQRILESFKDRDEYNDDDVMRLFQQYGIATSPHIMSNLFSVIALGEKVERLKDDIKKAKFDLQ